jgi:hypothetical protein
MIQLLWDLFLYYLLIFLVRLLKYPTYFFISSCHIVNDMFDATDEDIKEPFLDKLVVHRLYLYKNIYNYIIRYTLFYPKIISLYKSVPILIGKKHERLYIKHSAKLDF